MSQGGTKSSWVKVLNFHQEQGLQQFIPWHLEKIKLNDSRFGHLWQSTFIIPTQEMQLLRIVLAGVSLTSPPDAQNATAGWGPPSPGWIPSLAHLGQAGKHFSAERGAWCRAGDISRDSIRLLAQAWAATSKKLCETVDEGA